MTIFCIELQKVKHLVAFTAIYSNICTAHAQKWLCMNFRCKFTHRRSIRWPRFPIRVQNFSDLATFSIDHCILYAECLPYFYFRVVWPTDLESIPHAPTPTSIIPARFEVDMTIHCRVIAFLSADTSRDLVTLTFDLLTLNICHAWRVTWPTLSPSMKTPWLSVLELWVITFPVGYHWKCVRGHWACIVSGDPWVWGEKQLHFLYARPRFAYSLCNFGGSTMKVIKVICEIIMHGPVLKDYEFLRMREITWSVKDTLNVLLQSFSTTSIYRTGLQKLSI